MRYTIVIDKSPRNYAAYVPDLPGCVATGASEAEAVREISEAIRFHVESLRPSGQCVPGVLEHRDQSGARLVRCADRLGKRQPNGPRPLSGLR